MHVLSYFTKKYLTSSWNVLSICNVQGLVQSTSHGSQGNQGRWDMRCWVNESPKVKPGRGWGWSLSILTSYGQQVETVTCLIVCLLAASGLTCTLFIHLIHGYSDVSCLLYYRPRWLTTWSPQISRRTWTKPLRKSFLTLS